jgi:hypothetical protein
VCCLQLGIPEHTYSVNRFRLLPGPANIFVLRVLSSYRTAGWMFGLLRKKFVASYLFFKAPNRS